jgi:hypothetical protein
MAEIGMTPEEEQTWIQESFAEATTEKLQELESTEAIQKMLAAPEIIEAGIYKFGDVEIRHRKYMTSALRRLLSKSSISVKADEDPIRKQDDTVYRALAVVCMDAPWNNPASWELIDLRSKDGRVYKIFLDIIKKIGGTEQSLKTFQ